MGQADIARAGDKMNAASDNARKLGASLTGVCGMYIALPYLFCTEDHVIVDIGPRPNQVCRNYQFVIYVC